MAFQKATRTINVGHLSCDVVSDQIRQLLIEVSNGIAAEKLIFIGTRDLDAFSIRIGAEKGFCRLLDTIHTIRPTTNGLLNALSELESSRVTAEIPVSTYVRARQLISLPHYPKSDSILLVVLAAEILTHQGSPTLPTQAIIKSQQKAGSFINLNGTTKHVAATLEKRINVDDYHFFELVHPAYFRQTVALATLVGKFIKNPSPRAIDVGTGPGTNLLAFQELMPHTEVLAIEPSDVAFQYFKGHFTGNAKMTCLQEDFLTIPAEPEKFDYIMSTGASHHFNTDGFLQDEMIPFSETRTERSLNLLRHHLAYMTPLCFPWPTADNDVRTPLEREFVDDYNRTVPRAKFYTDNGDVDAAEILCRGLISRLEQHGFTTKVPDPQLAFWRFQWLELQALVAGLDYKVEQKTYPQHFMKMAEGAGLICVVHERVYGTVGLSDDGAGTHVMAFQKA